jgi:PAS domain S-box-containing protein
MSEFLQSYSQSTLSKLSRQELIAIIIKQQASQPTSVSEISSEIAYNNFCRQIAKNFPNGAVAILDQTMTYQHVAGEAIQQLGLTVADFVGNPLGVVVPPEEAKRLQTEFQSVLKQGELYLTDVTVGQETYQVTATPLASENGNVEQILVLSQNITRWSSTLRQAQESEEQFRTLAESIPGAVYVSTNDQDRKVLYISEGINRLCGYPVEDFVEGRIGATDLIHVDDQKVNEEAVAKAVSNQQPYHLTYRIKHRDGSTCWVEEYGANVTKEGKQYFQGVLFDISEKKQYEEDLQKQNEELKRMNRELDQFSYSVSHDLRAPLTSALGLLHLLKTEKDPVQRDQFVALAEQSLHQLNNFIQEIISLTRNSRTELTLEEVNLNEMVAEVVATQQQNADHDRVEVRNHTKPNHILLTDRRRLQIVLNNLISNAIRYHRPGHERPYVQISAHVEPQQTTLRVEDNGIGIGQEHRDKVFNMFYRATDHVPGSGLGLYLVKETVEKLRGQIKVDSRVNQGSTFTVLLPSLKE